MAHIERRESRRPDRDGRVRVKVRYKIRYRDHTGREHSETVLRRTDAERRKAEIEHELAHGRWHDPRRGRILLSEWAGEWVAGRHDLRPTTHTRLKISLSAQVLPAFGSMPLDCVSNQAVRRWVGKMLGAGLSAATVRKAVFALRQCLAAAVADNRITVNPAVNVSLPSETLREPRFLSQVEVARLVDAMPDRYRALVLAGAYAGLRWGEAAGLTRADIDLGRSRIRVRRTAIEVRGLVMLDQEPKTRKSNRSIPVARAVIHELDQHLRTHVGASQDALVFTAPMGGPLRRSLFARRVWGPAVAEAGLDGVTFHGLRHSFVAILVAAGCNVREVSEWAGHNNVAFTLTRYGGLFDDGSEEAVERLDALLGTGVGSR